MWNWSEDTPQYFRGRRIIELKELEKHLWCWTCKQVLTLENIEDEMRRGIGSILYIRCHECLIINQVPTGKQYADSDRRITRFKINSDAVKGMSVMFLVYDTSPNICFPNYYFHFLNFHFLQVKNEYNRGQHSIWEASERHWWECPSYTGQLLRRK